MSQGRPITRGNASNYYYEIDPIMSQSVNGNSEWMGTGAVKLGLAGQVLKESFERVLEGRDPHSGEQLVASGVNGEHRAGMDFVFSPPKSVSVHALHLNNADLITAHENAVSEALKYVESIVNARETENGQVNYINTGNVIAAAFTHSTSRANDPQLHTHAVVMNMTESNGDWKAISNESLFLSQNMINQVYQNQLAQNIRETGYSINRQGSSFELAGYKQEWIDTFSKRSAEVEKYLSGNLDKLKELYPEADINRLKDIAILASRDDKDKSITADDLKTLWESQVSRESIQHSVENAPERQLHAQSLDKAADLITETQSVFTKDQLAETYLKLNVGTKTYSDFETEFQKSQVSEQIHNVGELQTRIGTRTISLTSQVYTTTEVLETEKFVINALENQRSIDPYLSPEQVRQNIADDRLTEGQRNLVEHIASTEKQFSFIQGDAGTGKTHALDKLTDVLGEDVKILGASFTGKAAAEIEEKTGGKIPSFTLHSLQNNWDRHISESQPTLLIIDEASMIASKQFAEVIKNAERTDTRVVFIGDTKQLQPIQAGQLFKDSIDRFGADVVLSENLRQKTSITQEAVSLIKDFHQETNPEGIRQAMSLLSANDKIHEFGNLSEAAQKAVEDYVSNINADKETLLLTHKNELKDTLNQEIRERLLDDHTDRFELTVREQAEIRGADKFNAVSYEAGQSIFVTSETDSIKAGSEWKITAVDHENNSLQLTNSKSLSESISLTEHGNNVSAFTEQTKEFAAGDKVMFEKNDYLLGVKNGQTGHIESFENGVLSVVKDNGDTVSFRPENYNYLDYGYAITVHKAQGQTCDTVQYITDSGDRMINAESFYVAMTRATDDIHVYTDSADKLAERAEEHENSHSLNDMLDNKLTQENVSEHQIEI